MFAVVFVHVFLTTERKKMHLGAKCVSYIPNCLFSIVVSWGKWSELHYCESTYLELQIIFSIVAVPCECSAIYAISIAAAYLSAETKQISFYCVVEIAAFMSKFLDRGVK